MFGGKRGGQRPEEPFQNLSSGPEREGHAQGSISVRAQRSRSPRRSRFHGGLVCGTALLGHGQLSYSLPHLSVLTLGSG